MMKKLMISTLLVLSSLTAQADVFFKSNATKFINNDLENIKTEVRLSECTVENQKTANCKTLALLPKYEFKEMRTCLQSKIALGVGEIIVGGFLMVAATPEMGAGSLIFTPIIYHGGKSLTKVHKKLLIYSKYAEKDNDYIVNFKAQRYIELFKESITADPITCDASASLIPIKSTQEYKITLKKNQLEMLKQAALLE